MICSELRLQCSKDNGKVANSREWARNMLIVMGKCGWSPIKGFDLSCSVDHLSTVLLRKSPNFEASDISCLSLCDKNSLIITDSRDSLTSTLLGVNVRCLMESRRKLKHRLMETLMRTECPRTLKLQGKPFKKSNSEFTSLMCNLFELLAVQGVHIDIALTLCCSVDKNGLPKNLDSIFFKFVGQ